MLKCAPNYALRYLKVLKSEEGEQSGISNTSTYLLPQSWLVLKLSGTDLSTGVMSSTDGEQSITELCDIYRRLFYARHVRNEAFNCSITSTVACNVCGGRNHFTCSRKMNSKPNNCCFALLNISAIILYTLYFLYTFCNQVLEVEHWSVITVDLKGCLSAASAAGLILVI